MPSRRRLVIAGIVLTALAASVLVTVVSRGASDAGTTAAADTLWQRLARSSGEASEVYTASTLGDLGSVADVVVIGRVVSVDGVTPIPPADGVSSGDPVGPAIAHLTLAIDDVVLGTVDTPTPAFRR